LFLIGGLEGSSVLKSIFAYVKRIDGRMDRIEKILRDQSSSSSSKNIESLDEDFYSQLPMNDFGSVLQIENKLMNDEEFVKKMVNITLLFSDFIQTNFKYKLFLLFHNIQHKYS